MSCRKCGISYLEDPGDPFTQWLCPKCLSFAWDVFLQLRKLQALLLAVGTHKKVADRRILVISDQLWQRYLSDKEKASGC